MAKAGILEVADVFVVNKADRDGAGEVLKELRQMLHLGEARAWTPPVLATTATEREGIAELWDAIEEHRDASSASGQLEAKRAARLIREVEALAAESFRLAAAARLVADEDLVRDLSARRLDPYAAAAAIRRRG
jgi:LAO/AO transport system kinase